MLKYLQIKIGIRGEMATVLAVMGLTTLAMSLLNPILPLYLTSIGIGPVVLGSMLSVSMLGMAIGETGWQAYLKLALYQPTRLNLSE